MPLRDHFHGMLHERYHWESLYSAWAYHIIRQANTVLPLRYHGALHTHLGASFNVGSPEQDIVEVCFHDGEGGPRLVAVVELVSPGNKDRLENRRAFAVKCAAYLQ